MPEGDTVWHTAATLRRYLVGRTLTRCDIRVPRFATVDLTGDSVDEVLSRGKHLFIRVGRASIHSHLKMDGSWRVGPIIQSRAPGGHRCPAGAQSRGTRGAGGRRAGLVPRAWRAIIADVHRRPRIRPCGGHGAGRVGRQRAGCIHSDRACRRGTGTTAARRTGTDGAGWALGGGFHPYATRVSAAVSNARG